MSGGNNLVSKLPAPDPAFEGLHALLEVGASLNDIDAEVRRLCLISFVAGNERGIAYVMRMEKSDEAIDEAANTAPTPTGRAIDVA